VGPVIGARLYGGLGNQMFQYAAARSLALRRGTGLWLDATWFRERDATVIDRELLLADLPVEARIFRHPYRLPPAAGPRTRRGWIRAVLHGGAAYHRLTETSPAFDPSVASSPDGTLLDGYWQDERYFLDHAEIIRRELRWSEAHDDVPTAELRRLVRTGQSVGMHVRRGDYVSDPRAAEFHGNLTPAYYRRALELVTADAPHPAVYVFSDDPVWSRQNLELGVPAVFVDSRAQHPCVDMSLLRDCAHVVTANSSFSWWGAWLGDRDGRTVVAPDRWFAHDPARHIAPARWHRMAVDR
jgi:hypothetical protein